MSDWPIPRRESRNAAGPIFLRACPNRTRSTPGRYACGWREGARCSARVCLDVLGAALQPGQAGDVNPAAAAKSGPAGLFLGARVPKPRPRPLATLFLGVHHDRRSCGSLPQPGKPRPLSGAPGRQRQATREGQGFCLGSSCQSRSS